MGKVILDRQGELQKGVFYRFHVPFNDDTDGLETTADWIVVKRIPIDDELRVRKMEPYMYISPYSEAESRIETNDCPADPSHVTHSYCKQVSGENFGGKRVSPFVPMNDNFCLGLSGELKRRIEFLKLRGSRIDPLDLREHNDDTKLKDFWSFQFVGKATLRIPKFMDARNRCPYCGQGVIACEACGQWNPYCIECRKDVATVREKHNGKDDKRLVIEEDPWRVIEGKTWDGSDLLQAGGRRHASRRFIDWLLRIHAAPFYAEPVWLCVDGMTDVQKQWMKELQKPLEA